MVKKQKNQSLVPVVLALVVILLLLGGAVYVHMKGSGNNEGKGVCCAVSDYPNCSVDTAGAAVTKDACSGTALQGKCKWVSGADAKCPAS